MNAGGCPHMLDPWLLRLSPLHILQKLALQAGCCHCMYDLCALFDCSSTESKRQRRMQVSVIACMTRGLLHLSAPNPRKNLQWIRYDRPWGLLVLLGQCASVIACFLLPIPPKLAVDVGCYHCLYNPGPEPPLSVLQLKENFNSEC